MERLANFVSQTPQDEIAAWVFRTLREYYHADAPPSGGQKTVGPLAMALTVHPSGSIVDALAHAHQQLPPPCRVKIEEAIPLCLAWWNPERDGLPILLASLRLSLQLPAVPVQAAAFQLLTSNRLEKLTPDDQDEVVALLSELVGEGANSRFAEFWELVSAKQIRAPSLLVHKIYREISIAPRDWAHIVNSYKSDIQGYSKSGDIGLDIFVTEVIDKVGRQLFAKKFRTLATDIMGPILAFLQSPLAPITPLCLEDGQHYFVDRETLSEYYALSPTLESMSNLGSAQQANDEEMIQEIEDIERFDSEMSDSVSSNIFGAPLRNMLANYTTETKRHILGTIRTIKERLRN